MPKRKKQGWPEGDRAFSLYAQRVGDTPREHLQWALRHVETPPGQRTPGDRENLRMEIAALIARRPVPPIYSGVLMGDDKGLDAPSDDEVVQILGAFNEMLTAALNREKVPVATVKLSRFLSWHPASERFVPDERVKDIEDTWLLSARWLIGQDIEKAGHLLKECPAHAPRGEPGETCKTLFVAKRPNQTYCSGTCQTRAATRAYRRVDDTPVFRERMKSKVKASRKSRKEV